MILISIIITVLYLFLIGSFVFGFDKVHLFKLSDIQPKTKFSVIIPFRNEAENLPSLLESIKNLNYPKQLFEVFLVDDESDDNSLEIIIKSGVDVITIPNKRETHSPKKDAISNTIKYAKNEWIVTTDADCVLPKYWLDSFDEFIQIKDVVCVVAPVILTNQNSFLNRFQLLDMLSLQGTTMGGFGIKKPFLCNGANFVYKKDVFNKLNGFEGNTNIASGDDIFLLERVLKTYPKQLHYLKCEHAIVSTKPQPTWNELISQRIRWAAKTSAYNNWFGKLTGLIVLLKNAILIIGLLLSIIGVFNIKIWLFILIIKLNIDFFLIYKSATFFNLKNVLVNFVTGFFVYPFFSVYVAFKSLFSGYHWKGRPFKK
ncbi:glycosyltransferase [Litoribaculum gwangyangense]|uniref:Glycosyltransferase n=1 Tax=Litoribaculum gwangyangense TaxID=1130722 RepID=A0ABP9C5D8_9FLAO